jgi:hypothetical protein
MNTIIMVLVISGLIELEQSASTQPPNIAELNQQLINGYI